MRRDTLLGISWFALIVTGILSASVLREDAHAKHRVAPPQPSQRAELRIVRLGHGMQGLADAGGYVVPLRPYQHIAAGTTIADDLLLHLAEPERITALTVYGEGHSPRSHLYGKRAKFGGPTDLERLTQLGVDLIITNHLGAPAELARARDAGIQVFNLGEMRGLVTLLPNMEAVATLLGDRSRGARLARDFVRQLEGVAADIPKAERKRGVYVSAHGGQLFGGSTRSSYHDVLLGAGLIDAAAEKYSDFPHYDPEQLLEMDPDIIVTQLPSVSLFCRISGLSNLRACQNGGQGIVGMDDALLGDPGLGMLDAAMELRALVYGSRR